MPTSTFFNLPAAKQERLLDAAAAEFGQKSFGQASINRIIQAAGIPRGSFYQYFADKADLFRFVLLGYAGVLETAVERALARHGGDLMYLPLALFDMVIAYNRANQEEIDQFLNILRQNIGMSTDRLLSLTQVTRLVLEKADWSGLDVRGEAEQRALLELLFTAAGQSLMAVFCGILSPEDGRERLSDKISIIRRGAERKEENPC